MKKSLLFFLPVLLLPLFVAQAQTDTLLYETFDGGIPDTWTIGPGTPEGAVWQWSADGTAAAAEIDGETRGALFWGTLPAIGSSTVSNGAAMFNSDVYDNGGNAIGQGPFPGTHSGTLTSPVFDCTGFDTLLLVFHQFARSFSNTVSTILEVSPDSGQTWVGFPINERIVNNGITPVDDLIMLNISEVAGNQPNVQIRFTWNGRYYFWLIDDVQVFTPVDQELFLGDVFYSPSNFATPVSQIEADTFDFLADVSSFGGRIATNVVLKASVFRRSGVSGDLSLVYTDSVLIDEFPPVTEDSTIILGTPYIPQLNTGDYVLRYDVYSLDGEEFNPRNNRKEIDFRVTGSLFSKEPEPSSFRRASGDYSVGNYYKMSTLAEEAFVVSSVTFAGTKNESDGSIAGDQVTIFLYKVKDYIDPDFINFDSDLATDDLELIAFNFYTFQEGDERELVTIDLTDLDLNPVALEPGGRYFLMSSWEGESNILFAGFYEDIDYFQISTIARTTQWFLGGFGSSLSSVMRMSIELGTTADEQPLPEQSMNIFPNPIAVNDQLNVQLDLEERMPAMLVVADLNGRVISIQEYPDGVQNETLQVSTSQFAAGTYLVRLRTDAGTKTMKFNVLR